MMPGSDGLATVTDEVQVSEQQADNFVIPSDMANMVFPREQLLAYLTFSVPFNVCLSGVFN